MVRVVPPALAIHAEEGKMRASTIIACTIIGFAAGCAWTYTEQGDLHQHTGKTLEEAHLAALHWPETPPPF